MTDLNLFRSWARGSAADVRSNVSGEWRLGVVVAVVLLTSCGWSAERNSPATGQIEQQQQTADGKRRLNTTELSELFRGRTIFMNDPVSDAASHWAFGCDGEWTAIGGQSAEIGGAYAVTNDELCIDAHVARTCFAVYRSQAGAIFMSADPTMDRASDERVNEVNVLGEEKNCSDGDDVDLGDPPQLSGWEIWRPRADAHDVTRIERFYSTGLWEGVGGRALRTGRFTQRGDLVCVFEPPTTQPFCRRVRQVANGAIAMSAHASNEVSPIWSEYRIGERIQ